MRPDFGHFARQQREIAGAVGETATFRQYAGVSAGQPQYGIGDTTIYLNRTVTGLLRLATFPEIQQAGGQIVAGDVMATLLNCQPSFNDRIIWRGVDYRIDSDFVPERILGASAYVGRLRRADATA